MMRFRVRGELHLISCAKDWQISKEFTLEVPEKMPEAEYGFGGLMPHVADSSVGRFWLSTSRTTVRRPKSTCG